MLDRDDRREVRGGFWYGMRWFAVLLVIIALLTAGGWAWKYVTADTRGKVAANEKIKADPNFRIEAYERFYNQCASVQSLKANLAAQKAELATTKDDRRRGQLQTNISALTAAIAEGVNQYNADSTKTYTAGQFKSSDLPYTLTTEGDTSCAA